MGERSPLLPSALNPHAVAFAFPGKDANAEGTLTTSPTTEEPLPFSAAPGATGPTPPSPHDPWAIRRAQILSPHTREGSSSEFSYDTAAPTTREFRFVYVVQCVFAVVLVGAALGGLVAWTKYFLYTEFAIGGIAWLATETLKEVIFELFTRETPTGEARLGLPTVVHAIFQELIRLGAIYVTVKLLPKDSHSNLMPPPPPPRMPSRPHGRPLPPLDVLFFSACFLALGWATLEIIWNLRDFMKKICLYDDVLEDEDRYNRGEFDEEEELVEEEENIGSLGGGVHSSAYGSTVFSAVPLHQQPHHTPYSRHPHYSTQLYPEDKTTQNPLDGPQFLSASAFDDVMDPFEAEQKELELESQIREVERKEVEETLGVPLYQIPVVVVCIWRVDSMLLSVVLTLLLSLPFRTTSPSLFPFPLIPTFLACTSIHALLSLLWVSRIKWIGIPAVSYFTLVALLGGLFAVGAAWGALN